jgi:ABC-type nitrate/sulfonate/bicarbonate transport system substrate-binding protein
MRFAKNGPILIWSVLLVLALALTGCAGDSAGEGDSRAAEGEADGGEASPAADEAASFEGKTLRVAFASDPDFTQIANYKWLRDLEEVDGVTVQEEYFKSSQDSFRALVAGEVDLAFGTLSSGIALVQQGGDPIKAIVSDMKAPDYILVAQSDIADLAALEGSRDGISTPGDISDSLTRAVLSREGVDVDAVEFLQIGGTSARMSALLADQIDAGPAHAADGLAAMREGDLKNLHSYGNTIEDYLQQVVFVNENWAAENADFVQHLVNGFVDSVRWAAENKDAYIELSQEFVDGLDADIASQAYDVFTDIEMFAVNGGMARDLLENTVAIEQEVGALGQDVPPLEEWADVTYVEAYLEEHGEV